MTILYSDKSKDFLDLIKTQIKENECLLSNRNEIQSDESDQSISESEIDIINEMEDEILNQKLYKDLPAQQRQYDFSNEKKYVVNLQLCMQNIKSNVCTIDFNFQQVNRKLELMIEINNNINIIF